MTNENQIKNPVRDSALKRIKTPQMRMILDYCGVPFRSQPRTKKDTVTLLLEKNEHDPLKMRTAYDLFVLGKTPEPIDNADVQKQIDAARDQLYSLVKDMRTDEAMDALTSYAEKLIPKIEEAAKTELKKAANDYRPIVIKSPGKKNRKVEGVLPDEFERMVQLGSQRIPMYLVGPSGCGKTYLAAKLAEALGFDLETEYADMSMSEGVSESQLTGWLLPTGKGGAFEYVPSPFINIYENGGVFLFDEVDAGDPNLMVFMNKSLANDSIYIPQRHENPLVKRHPNFVPVAAANTFGTGADAQYVGRNQLDAATLDRFRAGMIFLDYSDRVEEALVDADVLNWGRSIRKQIKAHGLQRIMSTRVMLDMTKMALNCDWKFDDWNHAYFADWSREERRLINVSEAA